MERSILEIGKIIKRLGMVFDCFDVVGTQDYNNGDKYIGEWKDNKKDGKGKVK